MNKLDSRIRKLESSLDPVGEIVCLPINVGESLEDCIRRHGFDPVTSTCSFVPLDEKDMGA